MRVHKKNDRIFVMRGRVVAPSVGSQTRENGTTKKAAVLGGSDFAGQGD